MLMSYYPNTVEPCIYLISTKWEGQGIQGQGILEKIKNMHAIYICIDVEPTHMHVSRVCFRMWSQLLVARTRPTSICSAIPTWRLLDCLLISSPLPHLNLLAAQTVLLHLWRQSLAVTLALLTLPDRCHHGEGPLGRGLALAGPCRARTLSHCPLVTFVKNNHSRFYFYYQPLTLLLVCCILEFHIIRYT